jgi:hypothetical protein
MNQNSLLFSFSVSLVGLALLLINTVLFLIKYKGKDRLYKIFTFFLILISCEQIACNVLGFTQIYPNIFLAHFNFNVHLLFLSILYYHLFSNPTLKKIVVLVYCAIAIFLGVQYYTTPSLFWQFNIPEIVLISIVLICYALIHIYHCIGAQQKYFNFSIGLIMFLFCSTIIYLSGKYELVFCYNPYIDIWIFNSIFFIVFQFFIFKEWKKQIKYTP